MKEINQKNRSLFFVLILLMHTPLLVVGGIMMSGTRLYVNLSNSLPHFLYIGVTSGPHSWRIGDYVVFNHPNYPTQLLIKRLRGLPGDTVAVQSNHVSIRGEDLSLLKQMRKGRPLHPLGTTIIFENHLFVAGTHPRSFDSRYEEFGLVHQSQIKGQAWPLF